MSWRTQAAFVARFGECRLVRSALKTDL